MRHWDTRRKKAILVNFPIAGRQNYRRVGRQQAAKDKHASRIVVAENEGGVKLRMGATREALGIHLSGYPS